MPLVQTFSLLVPSTLLYAVYALVAIVSFQIHWLGSTEAKVFGNTVDLVTEGLDPACINP